MTYACALRRFLTPGCAAAAMLLSACGGDADAGRGGPGGFDGRGETVTPAVEVVQARYDALPLRERLTGTVRAAGQTPIYAQTSGPITAVYVENGQTVTKGQPLLRIESRAVRAGLSQAEASLQIARAEAEAAAARVAELESQFQRTMLLAEDSLVSQETVEVQRAQLASARAAQAQAQAQVQSAQAAIEQQSEAVGRTIVRAPISGVVGQREAEVGMIADGQTPLFVIGRMDRMYVEVPIAQDMIGRITPGQRALIRTDAQPEAPIEAEVSRISPFLAEGSFSAEAEIEVPEPGGRLVPGMFVAVDVLYGESDSTTVVPVSALYDNPASGRTGIYVGVPPDSGAVMTVASDGTGSLTRPAQTRFVPVRVVAEGRQTVGVTGVEPGDWVVVIGQDLLSRRVGEGPPVARLRPSGWDRIIRMQERQGPDLLREVMEEHERLSTLRQAPASGSGSSDVGGS